MIDMNYPNPYENVGKARIYGIESFGECLLNDNTTLTLTYTYMNAEKISDETRLLRRPDNKVTCKLKTAFKKLDVAMDISYVGNRIDYVWPMNVKLKSYILGNVSFNYQ